MMEIPIIDRSFIEKWPRKSDKEKPDFIEDEKRYQNCLQDVKKDVKQHAISPITVERILDWKAGKRKNLKRFITRKFWGSDDFWERIYIPRFHLILDRKLPANNYLPLLVLEAKDLVRKLGKDLPADMQDELSNLEGKAKGFGIPVSSTFLHFLYPTEFPIIDVRTREMLYLTANTRFIGTNDPMEYGDFRLAMLGIQKETGYDLHAIDRALSNFHKNVLQPAVKYKYKDFYRKLNPIISEEIGNGPEIEADPYFRRLLIDMIKYEHT